MKILPIRRFRFILRQKPSVNRLKEGDKMNTMRGRLSLRIIGILALLFVMLCLYSGTGYAAETTENTETTEVKKSGKKKADYTAVDEAIASVPKNLSKYSDKSRLDLEKAILAVNRNKLAKDQDKVDRMAARINNAIAKLTVGGWHTDKKGVWYCEKDQKTRPGKGFKKIRGKYYWFNSKGYRQTGWVESGGNWYLMKDDGTLSTGWVTYNGEKYFFRKNGTMKTGFLTQQAITYYLNSNGSMRTGWLKLKNDKYYFDKEGAMVTGVRNISGKWYYFMEDGRMAKNGWIYRNNKYIHFGADGAVDKKSKKAPTLVSMPGYFISPMYAGQFNTPKERIEAMIRRAYDYKNAGTTYKICCSQRPGQYADCSGLVMQCLYAAAFDPAPATPAHHAKPENEYDSRTMYRYLNVRHVSVSEMKRGDLIFYNARGTSTIIHVAIYLGDGKVIESWPPGVTDRYGVASYPHTSIYAVLRPFE